MLALVLLQVHLTHSLFSSLRCCDETERFESLCLNRPGGGGSPSRDERHETKVGRFSRENAANSIQTEGFCSGSVVRGKMQQSKATLQKRTRRGDALAAVLGIAGRAPASTASRSSSSSSSAMAARGGGPLVAKTTAAPTIAAVLPRQPLARGKGGATTTGMSSVSAKGWQVSVAAIASQGAGGAAAAAAAAAVGATSATAAACPPARSTSMPSLGEPALDTLVKLFHALDQALYFRIVRSRFAQQSFYFRSMIQPTQSIARHTMT